MSDALTAAPVRRRADSVRPSRPRGDVVPEAGADAGDEETER